MYQVGPIIKGLRNISTNHSTRSIQTANSGKANGIMTQRRLNLIGIGLGWKVDWVGQT